MPPRNSRHRQLQLLVVVAVATALVFLQHDFLSGGVLKSSTVFVHKNASVMLRISTGIWKSQVEKKVHVAIVNAPRYHFEVICPLLYTFSRQPLISNLELVATNSFIHRFDMARFLDGAILPGRNLHIREPKDTANDSKWNPDVMVLVSCMNDLNNSRDVRESVERVLTQNPKSTLVCVLHEVRLWGNPTSGHRRFIEKWIRKGRVQMLVLSQHVKNSLEKEMVKWEVEEMNVVSVFVPVFPVNNTDIGYDPKTPLLKAISIPGKYEPWRRSYKPIFSEIANRSTELQSMEASVHLVGFGEHPKPIPPQAKDLIYFHDSLDFGEYWRQLRSSIAIATAFANDHYVTDQASSTVATSLIVGVPLICGRDVLNAYTYLSDEEDIWLLNDGESVIEGLERVLLLGEEAWNAKRARVAHRREECENENSQWAKSFFNSILFPPTPSPSLRIAED